MKETEVLVFRTVFRFLFLCFGGGTLFSPVAFGRGFVVGVVPRDCRTGM